MKLPESVFKFLDCSTQHVTKKDMDNIWISNQYVTAYTYPEGAFIYVPPTETGEKFNILRKKGFSAGFVKALKKAQKLDCWFLRLDADGNIHEDLRKYEW